MATPGSFQKAQGSNRNLLQQVQQKKAALAKQVQAMQQAKGQPVPGVVSKAAQAAQAYQQWLSAPLPSQLAQQSAMQNAYQQLANQALAQMQTVTGTNWMLTSGTGSSGTYTGSNSTMTAGTSSTTGNYITLGGGGGSISQVQYVNTSYADTPYYDGPVSWRDRRRRRQRQGPLHQAALNPQGAPLMPPGYDVEEYIHWEGRWRQGQVGEIHLPDGSRIEIDERGNYHIFDRNARITYQANNNRAFNRYVNASDLLEEFIDFIGTVGGVSKDAFLELPVELFIRWLVLRAAQADGESFNDAALEQDVRRLVAPQSVPEPAPKRAHCLVCGRFLTDRKVQLGLPICSPEHYAKLEARAA